MTDRDLLELAAKAAGMWKTDFSLGDDDLPEFHEERGFRLAWGKGWWNPKADDGDALRLATLLNMSVKQDDPNAAIAGWSNLQRINITHSKQGPWYWKEWLHDHENNRTSATRRAIVRAAAEIGKAMP